MSSLDGNTDLTRLVTEQISTNNERISVELQALTRAVHERFTGGEFEAAVALIQDAIAKYPWHIMPYTSLANLYIRARDFAAAERMLEKAAGLIPHYQQIDILNLCGRQYTSDVYRLYGFLHVEKREPEKALEYLNRALELCKDGSTYFYVGRVHMLLGDIDRAVEALRAAAAVLPGDPDVIAMLKDLEE